MTTETACELSPIAKEVEKTGGLIKDLTAEIDALKSRLSQIIIEEPKAEEEKETQPDRPRCDIDRSINDNNNQLLHQIHRIREIIRSLQI